MNLQRPRAEEVEPTPRSSHRGKWDQIAIRPGGDFLMLRFVSTERDGLLYSSKCLACHDVSSMISRGGGGHEKLQDKSPGNLRDNFFKASWFFMNRFNEPVN